MLSPRQGTAVAHALSDDVLYLASGAVRSGKTAGCGSTFALYAARHSGDHALIGRTEASVMRNVVRPEPYGILPTLRTFKFSAKRSGQDGLHVSIGNGRSRIWIFGASDIDVVDRIAGSTFVSAMGDELTRWKAGEEAWQMLWSRLSTDKRKIWATTNPDSPRHWVKRQLYERRDQYHARIVNYVMADNPGLSRDIAAGIAAGLHGHFKQRLIDGLWVDATGLIYPHVTLGTMPKVVSHWSIGFDWAGSGVVAAVLLAHCAQTYRGHVAAERYYDHREHGALLDSVQAERVAKWYRGAIEGIPTTGRTPTVVYGDPTTPTAFQDVLAAWGLRWEDGETDVLTGIRTVSSSFGAAAPAEGAQPLNRRLAPIRPLTVDPSCVELRREIDEYSWDKTAAEKGEDRPQKGNDHGLDGLRYAWTTASGLVIVRQWA